MPSPPDIATPKVDTFGARDAQAERMQADLSRRQADFSTQETARLGRNQAELGGVEASLAQANAQPVADRQKVALPKPPSGPIVDAKQYESLSYGLIAMAMIGGALSKGNWLGVGASLNGAMDGYLKGNMEVAKKEYADYKIAFDQALTQQNQLDKEYSDAWTKKNTSINQKLAEIRVIAARQGREDMAAAVRSKDIGAIERKVMEYQSATDKLRQQHEDSEAKLDQQWQIEQGRSEDRREARADRRAAAADRRGPVSGAGGLSEKYSTDPAYAKNVKYWAEYMQKGLPLPARFAQSGAGKQMMPDIINLVPTLGSGNPGEMAAGRLNQREMTAEAQKLGTQSASVAIANKELLKFIPLAEAAIDGVSRTGWRPLNQLIRAGESTWSPEQKKLMIANRSVQNAYSQLIQRGAPTVHSLAEAEKLLTTADSPEVYRAAMSQLRKEGIAAEEGLREAHDDLLNRARGGGASSAPPPTQTATGPNGQKLELRDGAWQPIGGAGAIPLKGGRLSDQVPR